jgi:hypothetical protein
MGNRPNGPHSRYRHSGDEEHFLPPWQINIWSSSVSMALVSAMRVVCRKRPSVVAIATKLNIPCRPGAVVIDLTNCLRLMFKHQLAGRLFVKVNVSLVSWSPSLSFLSIHHTPAYCNTEYNSISHKIIFIIIIIIHFTAVLLVLRRVRVSLNTHFLFTVLTKLIIRHVLSTAAFCIKIYRAWRGLISFV